MTRKTSIAATLSAFLCLFSTLGWAGAAPIYYAHNDHLGTPQKLTDQSGNVVWQADYDPFGVAVVDDDPDSDGNAIEFNLRFPGQYYDKYTGKNYNYYRDYDPSTGRYLQSDPIGLRGGLNTYGYVDQNPLIYIDPLGLISISIDAYAGVGGGITIGYNESTGEFFGGGRVGFGYGAGINLDLLDEGPQGETDGYCGTKIGTFGNIGASLGPYGADYGFEGGQYTSGGDFSTGPSLDGTVNGFGGKGVSIGGAVGVQAIGY